MNFGVYNSNSNSTMLVFYDCQIEKINSQIKTVFDKFFSCSLLPPWLSKFVQLAIHNSECNRFSGSQLINRLFGKKKSRSILHFWQNTAKTQEN